MSTHRIVIFDAAGNALCGADIRSGGADLAACWIEDASERLVAQGIAEVVVVEFDPDEGGDYASTRAIECHTLKLETRRRPDGIREFVGMHHADNRRQQGRGHRIVRSTIPDLPETGMLRGAAESIADRAQRHRMKNNPRAWGIRGAVKPGGHA